MNNRVARATLAVIFIALLATPLVLKRLSARRTAERSSADARTTMARHGFYLQEVSQAAGIRFVRTLVYAVSIFGLVMVIKPLLFG